MAPGHRRFDIAFECLRNALRDRIIDAGARSVMIQWVQLRCWMLLTCHARDHESGLCVIAHRQEDWWEAPEFIRDHCHCEPE